MSMRQISRENVARIAVVALLLVALVIGVAAFSEAMAGWLTPRGSFHTAALSSI